MVLPCDCSSEKVIGMLLSLSLPSNVVVMGMSAEGGQHPVCPRRILLWILVLWKCQNAAFGRCAEDSGMICRRLCKRGMR